jgi:hypothetical protein
MIKREIESYPEKDKKKKFPDCLIIKKKFPLMLLYVEIVTRTQGFATRPLIYHKYKQCI